MMTFATDIRDAQRLVRFFSRRDFKELPIEFVLVPALDAPVLLFDEPPLFVDVTDEVWLALPELDEKRKDFRAVLRFPPNANAVLKADIAAKRAEFARSLRRLWFQIVDQADGYAWPDDPVSLYTFAPDP